MTVIISFVSQKGGVGKSTLSRALAREAAKSGIKVKIADLDTQQGTSVDWNRIRLENGVDPTISVESFKTAKNAIQQASNYDLLIIDGPARTSVGTLEIANHSDLVVQPTGASVDDLRPAIREFHALVKSGIPRGKLIFALNRISTASEERDCRAYISEAGYESLPGLLPEKAGYRQAQNNGFAITESPFLTLRKKADEVIQSIVDKING